MSISKLLKQEIADLPESPGIYKFFDNKNRLLYIGKSKNLKNRVRTYFRKQNDETQERTLIMINNIDNIKIEKTDTELEALILEDTLIKQHFPPYNVKQKKFRSQVFLAISSDNFPAINIITNDQIDFTNQVFGPFKDKYAAEYILAALQKILKLRKCNDPNPQNKCLLAGIDMCVGPCIEKISTEDYKEIIDIAIQFLQGNFEQIAKIIDSQIETRVKTLEFEEAAKLRDLKKFCINFCKRQKFMQDFMHKDLVITRGKYSFIFLNGNLKKVYKMKVADMNLSKYLNKPETNTKTDQSSLMDRAYVVWVWLKQNKAKYQIID
ncbi:MAG: GIY-YIG nuclease family protein [Candidatus Cloacimonetes bacterium]|nr:GIY-YIG nuclease family protein [Candidatus Cloacimonadota bacterium]MCF7867526.1 GIY-YIG nuclease family protein [Candidatus Cloacimonadota bacterium]MCF7882972.1 GIY-YIG nuclease family protein [Candidatus Cloacimonadota bacterium]